MIKDKDKQVNLLLDSLSGIDGDLLLDVEPARPAVRGRPARVLSWQRWASVAAVLVVLFVTGFLIRQFFWGGVSITEKAQLSWDGQKQGDFAPEAFPQSPEESRLTMENCGDPDVKGGRGSAASEISALADQTAAPILLAEGAADRIYSPAGLYHSQAYLLHQAGRGQLTESLSALGRLDESFFSLSNCLLVPSDDIPAVEGGAEDISIPVLRTAYLSDDCLEEFLSGKGLPQKACPPDQPGAAVLESRVLLQRFHARLELDVIAGAGEAMDGVRYETIPEAACYSLPDQTMAARIPAGGGILYLILPGEPSMPEEVLRAEWLFSWLVSPRGDSLPCSVQLPLVSVSQDHDWLDQGLLPETEVLAGEAYKLSMVRQRASLEWEARLVGEQSPGLPVMDFNRPFIIVFTDRDGLTLAAAVVRSPFS